MNDCAFCQIIQGEEEAAVAYEDDERICIMDRYPYNTGHVLVMPKKHYATLFDMPSAEVCKLFTLTAEISKAIVRAVKADGFNIGQNNGRAANQLVFHVHVHIIPRYFQDSPSGHFPTRKKADIEELRKVASSIQKEALGDLRPSIQPDS